MIKKWLLLLFATLVLGGCSYAPLTNEMIASADYGEAISQDQAERLAKQFLEDHLGDRYAEGNVRYSWDNIRQGWVHRDHIFGHGKATVFGYLLNVDVNYETQTAYRQWVCKPYTFAFHNGQIKSVYQNSSCVGKRIY